MAKRRPPAANSAESAPATEPTPEPVAPPVAAKRTKAKAPPKPAETAAPPPQSFPDEAVRRFLVGEAVAPAAGDGLDGLNEPQKAAVRHGRGPLLIIAGAGTGKTTTLVRRVAHWIRSGIPAPRILLLTFSRRAANEMLRRVETLLDDVGSGGSSRIQGGTFHAIGSLLLRRWGHLIGLANGFTILDRSDAEDLLQLIRTEHDLGGKERRFPQKATCLEIHSLCTNSRRSLNDVLPRDFPWYAAHEAALQKLFRDYDERKLEMGTLDYDDLLSAWSVLLEHPEGGPAIRARYDAVLVDEFQDTNLLQLEILRRLCPTGEGLTVVGDDAQSIYSFRAATVRNILDFPLHWPGTTTIPLEQNYRSSPQILAASNAVIAQARERHRKTLWSDRPAGGKPQLVTCDDEDDQADFVVDRILELREEGVPLEKQAVLFRSSHQSLILETELARRNIPFRKFGGLKFLEAAHIKDLLAFLRFVENPRDRISGRRLLLLLPGIGEKRAAKLLETYREAGANPAVWSKEKPPANGTAEWTRLLKLLGELRAAPPGDVPLQVGLVREFYSPLLLEKYDQPRPRLLDLEHLERLAGRFADRESFLADLTLDPPNSTADLAPEIRDDEILTLSTIHSAKGLEWDTVFVLHAFDGGLPAEQSTGDPEQLEEERRLLYVALTRAAKRLYVSYPQRWFARFGGPDGGACNFGQVSRFLHPPVQDEFESVVTKRARKPGRSGGGGTQWLDSVRNRWR